MTQSDSRSVEITPIGAGRFKATNPRGGATYFGQGGEDPDFTPVELLLAAIAGCSAIDVDLIVGKRAAAETFRVVATGEKVRDEDGNRVEDLRVSFEVTFPAGEGGDAARQMLPRAIRMSRDRLCAVSRTIQLGAEIDYGQD